MSRGPIIAIDGPAGAGKSTVARHLAQHFGLLNLETGAMYRAFALKAICSDTDFDDSPALERLARDTEIKLEADRHGNRISLDGQDVTERIRDSDVTQGASRVSVHPAIRRWMVDLQRELGSLGDIVMEGRDIGTVVFPDADIKVFLDASPEARSQRRYEQNTGTRVPLPNSGYEQNSGGREQNAAVQAGLASASPADRAVISQELRERDERDRNRASSPLRPAPDAIVIDSTSLRLEQVLARIEELVQPLFARREPTEKAI
ncbi:MAG TPA: (d)CMP kinase [Acidobacteriaceae bacterium]|jgi:cytidylate kinase|nr:(d)CMP kinase [Acidobacteriaceae bacterium]